MTILKNQRGKLLQEKIGSWKVWKDVLFPYNLIRGRNFHSVSEFAHFKCTVAPGAHSMLDCGNKSPLCSVGFAALRPGWTMNNAYVFLGREVNSEMFFIPLSPWGLNSSFKTAQIVSPLWNFLQLPAALSVPIQLRFIHSASIYWALICEAPCFVLGI